MNEVDISNLPEVATALENKICGRCQSDIKYFQRMKNELSKRFKSLDIYTGALDQVNGSDGQYIGEMYKYVICYFKELDKINDLINQGKDMNEIKEMFIKDCWYE